MAPAGRQQTFELIPNAPLGPQRIGNDPSPIFSKPPMTTKQAKKLHNQKNKGPKLSKAELRRIELMEQDRIRKEFEKEKAQARSRAARDKKKAKEDKEKEERKRKGLPLKDIHPSQDTISRFLNRAGTGFGKKHDSTFAHGPLDTVDDGDSETATEADHSVTDGGDDEDYTFDKENQAPADDDSEPESKAKRIRLSVPENVSAETRCPVASQHQSGRMARMIQESEADSYSRASSADTDDPINETLLENQLLADLVQASSRHMASRDPVEDNDLMSSQLAQPADTPAAGVSVSLASKNPSELSHLPSGLKPPQRSMTPVAKAPQPPETHTAARGSSHLSTVAFKKPTSPYVRPRPPARTTALPNGPPKFKTPLARPNNSTERPKFLPRQHNAAQHRNSPRPHQISNQPNARGLPTSTQAFLFNHADDLFPSPTQEARELAGDLLAETPKPNAGKSKLSVNGALYRSDDVTLSRLPLGPVPSKSTVPAAGMSFESSCLSTQDFIISTQDLIDIDTPSKPPPISGVKAPVLVHDVMRPRNANRVPIQALTVTGRKNIHEPERQTSVNWATSNATPADAAICGPRGSRPSSRHSQGYRSSCTSSSKLPSQQPIEKDKSTITEAASRPLRSSYQRHVAVGQQRSAPRSSRISISAAPATSHTTTPKNPAPKKRMFGSSGPGAEGLVAMERSHREMLREKRVLEERLRAEERLVATIEASAEELNLDLSVFADELLNDDDLGLSFGKGSLGRQGSKNATNTTGPGNAVPPQPKEAVGAISTTDRQPVSTGGQLCQAASQETDYGDFDDLDMDILKEDTSWIDEDLGAFQVQDTRCKGH